MSDMTPLSRRTAVSWELPRCVPVCLSVLLGKWRKAMKLRSELQKTAGGGGEKLFSPPWYITTHTAESLCLWNSTYVDVALVYSCVIQSSLALSSLSFLFSRTPYDIPLLDLLALCQCPCAPFFHLFPTSSVSPEGAFRLVKWSPACYGSPHSSPFSFIPLCSSQFLVSSVFASSLFFLGSFLIHFHILSPTRTHRNTHTLVHFYSLSLLSGSSSCHQSDKCQQSPHCLIWPSILPPSPLSPSLSILEQPSVS